MQIQIIKLFSKFIYVISGVGYKFLDLKQRGCPLCIISQSRSRSKFLLLLPSVIPTRKFGHCPSPVSLISSERGKGGVPLALRAGPVPQSRPSTWLSMAVVYHRDSKKKKKKKKKKKFILYPLGLRQVFTEKVVW